MTPAVLARLTARRPPRPAASPRLPWFLSHQVLSTLEAAREDVILERLATLTTIHGPWKAAAILFGGTR